jgi:DNA-directed RNA polymerase specialized sigma24 family protein
LEKENDPEDLEQLYKKLTIWAVVKTNGDGQTFDCGVSADDLVQETLTAYFESDNQLGWKKNKGNLCAYLCRVLENRYIDHVRRDKKVGRECDVEEAAEKQHPINNNHPDDQIHYDELCEKIRESIRGHRDEKELEEFLLATSMINNEGKVNMQLAELLGTDTDDVLNRRKKLLRLLSKKGIGKNAT